MMRSPTAYSRCLANYLATNALALLAAGLLMIIAAKNGGFSTLRFLLVGGTLLLAAVALGATIWLYVQPAKFQAIHNAIFNSDLTHPLTRGCGALFLIFWCITWIPVETTGAFHYYFIGLYPLILCGVLASGVGLLFLITQRNGFTWVFWREYWLEHAVVLKTMMFSLAAFALVVLLTRTLRILESTEPFWRGAGVPILASQVFAVTVIGVMALSLQAISIRKNLRLDLIIFLLVWAVTAILWAARPVPASFWVTGPIRPNYEYYPFSDLMTFDLGSQFALIGQVGQGIYNQMFFDRALYMSFLVYLHTLAGQDYQVLMAVQAAIFAIIAGLLYLVGKELHSRGAGLILSALTALRGLNSLTATPLIHSATFKHMLTDFPTAIGLAIFVLLILKWFQSPHDEWHSLLWAGGALGLTSLLRPHVLLLLPPLLLSAAWVYRSRWKRGFTITGVTLLAFLAGIAPWMLFGPSAGSIVALYGQRFQAVVQTRYVPSSLPVTPPAAQTAAPLPTVPPSALPTTPPATQTTAPLPVVPPSNVQAAPDITLQIPFPVKDYMHNLITSALIFPDSPEFLSVVSTVSGHEDFWQLRWDGGMSPIAALMLILNLSIVAFGFGAAYQRLRWVGLLPLAVFLIYHAANALARTSGGRYLVPVDWILVTYYALGLAEGIQICGLLVGNPNRIAFHAVVDTRQSVPAAGKPLPTASLSREVSPQQNYPAHATPNPPGQIGLLRYYRPLMVIVTLAMIGGLIPLAGILYPQRYPPVSTAALANEILPYASNLGLSAVNFETFFKTPGAVALYGRALYPRFYRQGGGVTFSYVPFLPANYPRTIFILIGPQGYVHTVLPGGAPKVFPNASDAIVLGCLSNESGIDIVNALAVVLPEQAVSYARSPSTPFSCPVAEPVCDKSGVCR